MTRKMMPLFAAAVLSTALAQTGSVSPERELLERHIATGWDNIQPIVMLKEAPKEMLSLLPPESRVVGTIVVQSDVPYVGGMMTYFDTALNAAQLSAHFDKTLSGQGWKVMRTGMPNSNSGGFQNTLGIDNRFYYRLPDQQLSINTRQVGQTIQVSLNIYRNENLADMVRADGLGYSEPSQRLPQLFAPVGAKVQVTGSGGGTNGVSQSAFVITDLSRGEVFKHYNEQLKKAGWRLQVQSETGSTSSSLWTAQRNGMEQVGLLVLIEQAKGQYRAALGLQ